MNKKLFHIFEQNQFLGTSDHWPARGPVACDSTRIYDPLGRRWYRRDMTPVLDEDVPKELKTALLLVL